ncbi:signal transduction protein [Ferriphaselus amnicola]|uniref:Signal transduction protein n=1 Tax=Ferriphaselus amnicola TaxID=1188319 RepID=A0A2Z6GE03_9PROT|nr:HDOD domain-containing protein [Ferriphaselus amnicola]BBE51539.1 signal transduction protein [Ferriphaselus amnicola]
MQQGIQGLENWVAFLSKADIPVLKRTGRELLALRQDPDRLSARGVAEVIARDPLMTVKLLRYLQSHKHRSQTSDVIVVEQALMMLGLDVFFSKIPASPLVEADLHTHLDALTQLLHVIHRAQRASIYAREWAVVHLHDMRYEEIRIAALLHDLAEMLMWCYEPVAMLEIRSIQQHDKALRSRAVQEQVLGFALADLQHALTKAWDLPELLLTLMDDEQSRKPRVRNVILAVNLARHSANGWDDAALPDDYKDIGELIRMPADEVMAMVAADAGMACDLTRPH